MSQFTLIAREIQTRGLPSVVLRALTTEEDFLQQVAVNHFGEWHGCRLVTDAADRGEPLLDEVREAQQRGSALDDLPFVQLLKALVEGVS